jgi:hypothetical protein
VYVKPCQNTPWGSNAKLSIDKLWKQCIVCVVIGWIGNYIYVNKWLKLWPTCTSCTFAMICVQLSWMVG